MGVRVLPPVKITDAILSFDRMSRQKKVVDEMKNTNQGDPSIVQCVKDGTGKAVCKICTSVFKRSPCHLGPEVNIESKTFDLENQRQCLQ
jgi:hypothetical protein